MDVGGRLKRQGKNKTAARRTKTAAVALWGGVFASADLSLTFMNKSEHRWEVNADNLLITF